MSPGVAVVDLLGLPLRHVRHGGSRRPRVEGAGRTKTAKTKMMSTAVKDSCRGTGRVRKWVDVRSTAIDKTPHVSGLPRNAGPPVRALAC